MRQKGSIACFKDDRDRDLMRAFREQLSLQKGEFNLSDILTATINSPTSHFWVSIERAVVMVHKIRKGYDLAQMGGTRREMFEEIEKRVAEIERAHEGIKLEDAVIRVIEGGAPKFYLTIKSAKVILHKIKKRWRNGQLAI